MLRDDTAAALLLTMCSPVLVWKIEPATVQPVHSVFLQWSRGLVWLELVLFIECCNLLIEWFASDTLVSCHTVNMERRQCPRRMSFQPFQD